MENELKKILSDNGFTFKKAFGQNFISDFDLLNDIVNKSGITSNDVVLEIGCGAGTLTRCLADKCKRVLGYEIDTKLKPVLSKTLEDKNNVEIIYKDILKENLFELEEKIGEEYIIVANLPYYITTPIIMEFVEKSKKMKSMVIMVQEEVAERLASKENSSDYGAITVAINLRGNANVILKVPREKFTPVPNVDSAVVKIDMEKNKYQDKDLFKVRKIVRAAFSSRRKTLVNNLMKSFSFSRDFAEDLLNKADLPLTIRGEDLSASDYVRLSDLIGNI